MLTCCAGGGEETRTRPRIGRIKMQSESLDARAWSRLLEAASPMAPGGRVLLGADGAVLKQFQCRPAEPPDLRHIAAC